MNKTNLSVAIALLATSSVSIAADDGSFYGFTPSASVALTTDYMWRGVSQSNNDPAIQGSFDLGHESDFYVGAWASSVEFGGGDTPGTSMELDVYGGFSRDTDFGGMLPFAFTYDLGVLRYEFSGTPNGGGLTELYFGGSISPFENFNFSTYYFYGLKIEDHNTPGEYTDISADYTLPDSLGGITILAHAGYYNQKDKANLGDDYWDWKVGIAKDIGGFNFEVAYHDTDNTGGGGQYGSNHSLNDGRVVATISREFGNPTGSAMLSDSFHASASAALTTNYIWRGVSQSNNEPAIQGSFDLSHDSGLYVGVWASSYEFNNQASVEIDLYGGFSRETDFGGFSPIALTYDIGFLRYEYTSAADDAPNFNEVYFGASVSPVENLNVSTYWYYGIKAEHQKPGEYTDMALDYTLPESLGAITLLGHAGYYNQKNGGDDYWDWKAGVARDFSIFNIEVAYTDTDDVNARNSRGKSLDDGKVVATISTTF